MRPSSVAPATVQALVGTFLLGHVVPAAAAGDGDLATPPAVAAAPPASPDVPAIQRLLVEQKLDGWLLSDFRGSNRIANEIVRPRGLLSHRWFYLVPQKGEAVAIVHKSEVSAIEVPGRKTPYLSWKELDAALRAALKGHKRVAMEYAPGGSLVELSRVDAGTIEWVRSMHVAVASSGGLVQALESRWTKAGHAAHLRAARGLEAVRDEAFAFVARRLREGRPVTEWDVASRFAKALELRGLDGGVPVVAFGKNTADPRYVTAADTAATLAKGQLVLVDATAKGAEPDAVCAAQTWMAYAGDVVPQREAKLFAAVRDARDAAVALVKDARAKKRTLRGYEVDAAARKILARAGHDAHVVHGTGHSLDARCYGEGANLDDYETHDERPLVVGLGFTVEPGVYLDGEIGVRSGIDVWNGDDGVEITSQGPQKEILALLLPVTGPAEPAPATTPAPVPNAPPVSSARTTSSARPTSSPPPTSSPRPPSSAPSPSSVPSPSPAPGKAAAPKDRAAGGPDDAAGDHTP